jgi:transforming growth factor-beta-induced protein
MSGSLSDGDTVPTLAGTTLTVSIVGGVVKFIAENGGTVATRIDETGDVVTSNGVIHAIDTVLRPRNIVQVAADLGNFGTLLSVATDLNLASALQGAGPLTVLAPTDTAFSAISDVLDDLTNEQKTAIVQGHIINGNVKSSDLADGQEVTTLSGSKLTVGISG